MDARTELKDLITDIEFSVIRIQEYFSEDTEVQFETRRLYDECKKIKVHLVSINYNM